MSAPSVAEARYAQGDLVRAAQQIVMHNLQLTEEGAAECERIIREYGEGNTVLWTHPNYLRETIYLAQEIVREVREGRPHASP
jgi:hypothetical protein